MSDVYNRLASLISQYGIKLDENDISTAELKAYSSGVEMVENELLNIISSVFLCLDDKNALRLYLKMLSINPRDYSINELREKILERLALHSGTYTQDGFDTEFSKIGDGTGRYTLKNKTVTFSNFDFDELPELGEFIKSYVYIGCEVKYSGSGLTFAEWDSLNKDFNELDSWNLAFSILNKLEVKK